MKKQMILFSLLQVFATAQEGEASTFYKFDKEQVQAYHKSSTPPVELVSQLIESQFFANAEAVLDLGCGDGKITALLAKKLPKCAITGCDISKSMIDFASQHFKSSEYSNLSFLEKDALSLEFDKKFDRVISFNCLHWTLNQQKAFLSIFTALKSGGKALILACPKSQQDDLQVVVHQLMTSSQWRSFFQDYRSTHSFHTEDEYKKMADAASFSVERIKPSIHEAIFENRETLTPLLSAVLTPLFHLPENRRDQFMDDFFAALNKKGSIDPDGKIHLKIAQIELLLTKP